MDTIYNIYITYSKSNHTVYIQFSLPKYKLYRQMKPITLLIIHYTSTSTSFSKPNTNGGPGNQSFICKGYEVFHQVHTHLNLCMNNEHLPGPSFSTPNTNGGPEKSIIHLQGI